MANGNLSVYVTLTNPKAVAALGYAAAMLDELAEEMPYREDVKKAARAAKYAVRRMNPKIVKRRSNGR